MKVVMLVRLVVGHERREGDDESERLMMGGRGKRTPWLLRGGCVFSEFERERSRERISNVLGVVILERERKRKGFNYL